jgi:hypothetical protein
MKKRCDQFRYHKGYVAFTDLFMELGHLDKRKYEDWRFCKTSCLENVIQLNFAKVNTVMKAVRDHCRTKGYKPSLTVYKSWGKTGKRNLYFTKGRVPAIEQTYSTHFVKQKTASKPTKTKKD